MKTCLLFILRTIHASENNTTVQHLALYKTSSGTYITDEDLLRLKRCTVWLFSDVFVVHEINNKQVLYKYLTVVIPGCEKAVQSLV